MPRHRKSCVGRDVEKHDLDMPDEYFNDTIRPQLWSLFEEDSLKDTTITLRASSVTMSSFILSLLSPVLRVMVVGNFRESISKEIGLDDVEAVRLLKLLQLACGKRGLMANDLEELFEIGELADRLQMEAVRSELEDKLMKVLRAENCLEGLCWRRMSSGLSGKAVVRWISNRHEGMRGAGLLRKVRYGVMSNECLGRLMSSESLPKDGMVKELVGDSEAMAKRIGAGDEGMWDGVERLCDRWMVARGMTDRIIGADVLKSPSNVAMDGQGRIVVSDSGLHEIIVFNSDGSIARRFGSRGAAAGQFERPMGVAVDGQGHIVVADYHNHRIQMLNADGSVARCFGSEGTVVGQFKRPWGVAIDRAGHVVVADCGNDRIQVFDADGSVVRHFGSAGAAIGQLNGPIGVAVDGAGRIVVVDQHNHRVQVFNGDGSVALCFGSEGDGPGQLMYPQGVAVDLAGRFVVDDTQNFRGKVFNPDGSVAHVIGSAGTGVGELKYARGVVVCGAGRFIVADSGNRRVQLL